MRFTSVSGAARFSSTFDRRTVPPDLLREYDTFGPWIGEVRSADDMPRRFREHHAENAGARFLLKIPMELDRRKIVPGQDLYRAVLAVHDDHLCRLVLDGAGVTQRRVDLRDIVAICNHTCLLLGSLRLHLADGGELGLSYNTSSQELIDAVVDFLRRRLSPCVGMGQADAPPPVIADYHFRNLVAEQQRRAGPCALVHCEEPGQVFEDASGRRRTSAGLLVFDSGAELTFVATGRSSRHGGDGSYALDRKYVPHRAVRGHQVHELRRWCRAHRFLRVQVNGHGLEIPIWAPGAPLLALLDRVESGRVDGPERIAVPHAQAVG